MASYARVNFNTDYLPSSEEQRRIALEANNARNLKRYQLKRLARELGRLEGRDVRTVALICEERRRHG